MRGHCSSVRDVAFSSSGRHLASAALDGEVRIWFTSTGTHVSSPDFMAGGMAQWFGRQSLSGGLSLIYAWSWLTCDHFVGKVSAMGQLRLPSLWGLQISSNPCNYMNYGGGYHQTADQGAYGCLVTGRVKVRGRRVSLRPIGCTPALPVIQQHRCSCSCSCRLWLCISVMPLPFTFTSCVARCHSGSGVGHVIGDDIPIPSCSPLDQNC